MTLFSITGAFKLFSSHSANLNGTNCHWVVTQGAERPELPEELREKIIDVQDKGYKISDLKGQHYKKLKKYKLPGTVANFLECGCKRQCHPRLIRQVVRMVRKKLNNPTKTVQNERQAQISKKS